MASPGLSEESSAEYRSQVPTRAGTGLNALELWRTAGETDWKTPKTELREIWPNEAADFTPWLAQNLDALGEAVGKDLVLVQREAPVGPYSLDLLLKDVGSDHIVVVENQLERTDHETWENFSPMPRGKIPLLPSG